MVPISAFIGSTCMSASASYYLSAGVQGPTHKSTKSAYSSKHYSVFRTPSSTPFAPNGSQHNDQNLTESTSRQSSRFNTLSIDSDSTATTDVTSECEVKTAEELTQMIVRLSEEELSMAQAHASVANCHTTYNAEYTANSPLRHRVLEL